MVNFMQLDYNSIDDYFQDFLATLLVTNHTYEFFVNWNKVFSNLEQSLVEISILNSLNKVSETKLEYTFRNLLKEYPEIVPILPSILAIRLSKVPIFDLDYYMTKTINFSMYDFDLEDIVSFSTNTGLLELFNKIDDLYSYLVGTEVGLDSNARKNRSGHIFENIVGNLLNEKFMCMSGFKVVKEDSSIAISRNKRFDFVVYENESPKFAIECNFYSSSGSKPIEVAHAYAELQQDLNENNIKFIWITDGMGWNKMFSALKNVVNDIEFIVNYNMLNFKFNKIFGLK